MSYALGLLGRKRQPITGVLPVAVPTIPSTYDEIVNSFGTSVVSYWKFANTGTDTKGVQNAAITGNPELNVETIVDIDRVAEGAPSDGVCIAWPGTAGDYAQANHNALHKTAAGTIVITAQRDTATEKSVLLCASETSVAGAISIEINTDGSPRAFLRDLSNAAIVLTGLAGDVQLNQAYTFIFKWGAGGLSYAVYNATGLLVRRMTSPSTDGLAGTSPIRFGAWHTDIAHHDGPYGRVIWMNRRISDVEEVTLARARTISRLPAGSLYTPFPFVTALTPAIVHTGITTRPTYNAANPLSTQITDPMSGIPIVRVKGNQGAAILYNGVTNSGLVWPLSLRNDNSTTPGRVWNSDGSLLFLDQSRAGTGDAGNAARSCLIDASGTHGASQPYQVLRAATGPALGNTWSVFWFWDPLNPLRAYVLRSDGSIDEWWPIGGDGHAVDEVNNVWGAVNGYNSFTSTRAHAVHCSWDGQYYMQHCRRNSDNAWGGRRRNLLTGALDVFCPTRDTTSLTDDDRTAQGTSALGRYTKFIFGGRIQVVDVVTNTLMFNTDTIGLPTTDFSHTDWALVNGREYLVGPSGGSGVYMIDILAGTFRAISNMATGNPNHYSGRNYKDLAETYGTTGGINTGQRYGVLIKSVGGTAAGIRAFRLGPNDTNATRYLAHHRGTREDGGTYSGADTNESEAHCQISPDGRKVAFNSNWRVASTTNNFQQDAYVILIPDGWWSPNTDGS